MILSTFFVSALALAANFGQNDLAQVEFDQSSYAVGARAMVFVTTPHRPENPNTEFVMEIQSEGKAISLLPVSETLSIGFLPRFRFPGSHEASISLYQRKKTEAKELELSIAFYTKENEILRKQRDEEKNEEIREKLEARIQRNESIKGRLQSQLNQLNTLLFRKHQTVWVSPADSFNGAQLNRWRAFSHEGNPFTLVANRSPAEYLPGERAEFLLHLNTSFQFPDGPAETLFLATLDNVENLPTKKVGENDFTFTTRIFTSLDVGSHAFGVQYFVRSKRQGDFLRLGNSKVQRKRNELLIQLQGATHPEEKAYLEYRLEEYTALSQALQSQLQESRLFVAEETLNFLVIN